MQRVAILTGVIDGALTSLPVMALFYLGQRLAAWPFVPFDLFEWLTRVLPGNVVVAGIDVMVRLITFTGLGPTDTTAKAIEQGLALGLFIIMGAGLGALSAWIGNAARWTVGQGGIAAGCVAFLGLATLELTSGTLGFTWGALLGLAVISIGWGAVIGRLLGRTALVNQGASAAQPVARRGAVLWSRRTMLAQIAAGSLGVALAAWGLGRFLGMPRAGAEQANANLPRTGTPGSSSGPG